MKKWHTLAKASAAVSLACLVLALAVAAVMRAKSKYGVFCDLNLRYNEVVCSHDGINPFKIWSHEITHDRYQGLMRYDMPEERRPGKLEVHAYPPWHTTFFWWYPLLPRGLVQFGFLAFNFLAFIAIGAYFASRLPPTMSLADKAAFCFGGLLPCAYVWGTLLTNGNYSVFVLVSFFLLLLSLKRGHDVVAGVCWAAMMVKPQMSALVFWPLLFAGKVKTIAVAAVILAVATLVPSFVYGESPVELVLQIPQIGLPYIKEGYASGLMSALCLSEWASDVKMQTVVTLVCFALCGVLSWVFSKSRSWTIRFVPMVLFSPIWSYSLPYDRVILVYVFFAFGLVGIDLAESRWGARAKAVFYVATFAIAAIVSAFPLAAALGSASGAFEYPVVGAIYKAWQVVIMLLAWAAGAFVAFNIREADERRTPLP